MDKALLVEPYLADTALFLKQCDGAQKPLQAAVWCHDSEDQRWMLWLASTAFDKSIQDANSYQPVRLEIIDLLQRAGVQELDLLDTKVVTTHHIVLQDIARRYRVTPDEPPLRVRGGRRIPDPYSYGYDFDSLIIARLTLDTNNHG
jgi:hypothetical protein